MKLISVIKQGQFLVIASFLLLIIVGTLLLKSPFCTHHGLPVSWVDSMFMATSAVCVTGLTTITVSDFNGFGQLVLLLLIQIGGLGIMSLSALVLVLLKRKLSYSSSMMLSNVNENFSIRNIEELILTIAGYTFIIEALGFILLVFGFLNSGYSNIESLYFALFHAISAFCNAGLSPFDLSLVEQSGYIKTVIACLVVCGGLGIYVIYNILHGRIYNRYRLQVHTKLILITSAILIVGGGLLIKVCQAGDIAWIDAFFMSVSSRTAGFNSVPMESLRPSTISVLVVLMLIGAAPGSTGGGIKVTAIALAFLAVWSTIKGNEHVIVFHRKIPKNNVMKAFTLIIIYIVLTILGTICLSAISVVDSDKTLFETASAICTVGLSLGFSMEADTWSQLLLIFYMFIGRIGPVTIFLFLLGREKRSHLDYPEERIIIG